MVRSEVLFLALLCVAVQTGPVNGQEVQPGCETRCGDVTIKYPFGTSPDCYLNEYFLITCNETEQKAFLRGGNIQVLNISHDGGLRVLLEKSSLCNNCNTNTTLLHRFEFFLASFTLSYTKNKFTAVGCDTYAYLTGTGDDDYSTGCMSVCNSDNAFQVQNGSCSGIGCCQIPIPRKVNRFRILPRSFNNHSTVCNFNPCSYAFIVEDGFFNFWASRDLKDLGNVTEFPVVLDWSIGNKTCDNVGDTSLCSQNSKCVNSARGQGYTCQCLPGFDGNPYLHSGCKDIDECGLGTHKCKKPEFCKNAVGSFECLCPKGYVGNATLEGNGCTRKKSEWAIILLGTTIGFLVFLLGVCCLNLELRRRKHIKLREKFFEQNGGFMLRQRLYGRQSSTSTPGEDIKIFTVEEIKKATDDYDESKILGEGGQGTVYKGILSDNREVAIKKARIGDSSQVEQFVNEVVVVSQINHRNVVKLLGCCLETEVPLLVYEFVSNGTLFDHLHTSKFGTFLPWEDRLRIATETAETLSYLHSSTSVPIIHRDVKPANILLDDNFSAKVSDFGASKLIPIDQEQVTTLVQGTMGYLDPEYFHSSALNEKSDVYSFGVVLMELISGQKALCFDRPQNAKHLASHFASALKENRLDEILDTRAVNAKNRERVKEAAVLAVRCTRVKGEERPRMKEVASALEGLKVVAKDRQWIDQYPEEHEHLLGEQILKSEGDSSNSGFVSGFDSIHVATNFDIESGR
ncbi:PREDICTED: wall-associated receptor kinase 2-like [Tarenaya hassleriana]|uniref:wall-associated receptor kinase 2-like n=1 Tax=Tarenaya hassleriana TaxID=28532 RepID=UPI00053C7E14|nr:PREDICTED: wall-associated receptor kinase 2-like [Tarenaya hassleriana]